MIRLIAESKSDGWAIALDGERHWLVRPPYRREDLQTLTPREAARALADENFDPADERFEDWGPLVRELQRRRVGRATPEELSRAAEAAEKLLARASREQALEHFDRLDEALAQGHRAGVEGALIALLGAESVKSEPLLVERARELLERSRTLRGQASRPSNRSGWVVRDEASVDAMSKAIAQRGMVLDFGGLAAA